jgi:FdrA protein
MIGDVYSNAPIDPKLKLADSYKSEKDSIVDLGEEEFTVGRAHPMIDPTIRKMRLVEEAKDPEVAVIIMDVMLGYGSHSDPAGAMLSAVSDAKKIAERDGRVLPMLAHVCGTEQDPQPLSEQIKKLRNAGIEVFPTNALMAIAGALISRKGKISSSIMEDVYGTFLTGF